MSTIDVSRLSDSQVLYTLKLISNSWVSEDSNAAIAYEALHALIMGIGGKSVPIPNLVAQPIAVASQEHVELARFALSWVLKSEDSEELKQLVVESINDSTKATAISLELIQGAFLLTSIILACKLRSVEFGPKKAKIKFGRTEIPPSIKELVSFLLSHFIK